jgi:hypothetical protein
MIGRLLFWRGSYGFVRPTGSERREDNVFLAGGGIGFEPETGDLLDFEVVEYEGRAQRKAVGVKLLQRAKWGAR